MSIILIYNDKWRYVQIMSIILIYNDKWRFIMVNNGNKCPECGSNNIHINKTPHFDGVIVDCKCNECDHEWHYENKK